MNNILRIFIMCLFAALSTGVNAQGAKVAFGSEGHDSSLPIEATSEELSVDQTNRFAIFTGDVLIVQGELKLTGDKVRVEYNDENEIDRVTASGNVTIVNAVEAAEAQKAVYTLESGVVIMTGDVVMTQGFSAVAGDRLRINLDDGTGVMEGRVKTILQPDKE